MSNRTIPDADVDDWPYDDDPDDDTIVFVYDEKIAAFQPVKASQVRCPECGAVYTAGGSTNSDIWWDDAGDPAFLQCDCGEQFYQTEV